MTSIAEQGKLRHGDPHAPICSTQDGYLSCLPLAAANFFRPDLKASSEIAFL